MEVEKLLDIIQTQEKLINTLKEKDLINEAIISKYEELILRYDKTIKMFVS